MKALCRAGHLSEELDYCSVCGAPLGTLPSAVAAPPPATACPACGEPREAPSARYCEVCRHDFVERRPGPPPIARGAHQPPPPPAPEREREREWELVVTLDASLDTDPDPAHPCPANVPPRVIAVDRAELLVGRHDDQRDIHPEVPLFDPGASRRHAKLVREPDGGVALQDLASTNGTQINGAEVPAGARRRLAEGDEVTLGRWTRIALRGRS